MLAARAPVVPFTMIVRPIRYCGAILWLVMVVALGGPLGCELIPLPGAPSAPKLDGPPDLSAPSAPGTPKPPEDEEGGACCIRGTAPVEQVCGAGATRCCSTKYDRDACEEVNGSWFQSVGGCRGAC
jgi:hypothetical protein